MWYHRVVENANSQQCHLKLQSMQGRSNQKEGGWDANDVAVVCIYLPYQIGAELCPSIVSLYSEVEVPPERGGDFLTPRHG